MFYSDSCDGCAGRKNRMEYLIHLAHQKQYVPNQVQHQNFPHGKMAQWQSFLQVAQCNRYKNKKITLKSIFV